MSGLNYYGKPVVGNAEVFSSGSCFAYIEGYNGTVTFQSSVLEINEWFCHYCGGAVSGKDMKCPNCAGERRQAPDIRTRSRTVITYEQEFIPPAEKSKRKLFDLRGLFK